MTNTPSIPKPSLVISKDMMAATIKLPSEAESPSAQTVECCRVLLVEKGVELSSKVEKAIVSLIAQHNEDPQSAHAGDVAVGVPPKVGRDGRLEFVEGFDPDLMGDTPAPEPDDTDEDSTVDYYNNSVFCLVKKGDLLGHVIPPVPCSPGKDVFGDEVPVYGGQALDLQLDGSIDQMPDGRLVAQTAGVLEHVGKILRVRTDLEIHKYVDFSTGNIAFGGDVTVNKGVRDCFIVEATGSVTVRGLVEAATINTGEDAYLNGGMAAREKGSVHIKGNLEARYLDNVDGEVGRSLIIKNEIINCRLHVKGDVVSERAVLTGGRLTVGGKTELGEIGSDAGVPTELAMGRDKAVDGCDERIEGMLEKIAERKESLMPEYEPLHQNLQKLGTEQQKRHRDLRKAIRTLEDLAKQVRTASGRLHSIADNCVAIEITVTRVIQPGARLLLGDLIIEFTQALAGPIRIRRDKKGEMVIEDVHSGSQIAITSVACVEKVQPVGVDDDESAVATEQAASSSRAA
jgi:uncharacterized protein